MDMEAPELSNFVDVLNQKKGSANEAFVNDSGDSDILKNETFPEGKNGSAIEGDKNNVNGHVAIAVKNEKEMNNLNIAEGRTGGERSTFTRGQPPAIAVRNAIKSYSSRGGVVSYILDGLNMTVKAGSIYSLLGSSGCGKTTLLSCVVGIKALDSGSIRVFGHEPGSKKALVPGRNVGYMPQEIALYDNLTIQEVMQYFGGLFGMTANQIMAKIDFIVEFLALPKKSRKVGSLSGGQKRRVSFGVAMIHSPKLLILDEPTVGVDPLLRQSIWKHLLELVATGSTTVVITTHYIEEARQSNQIGLMRNGRLLAEESPEFLLQKYNTNLLEDIVLKLCLQANADSEGSPKQERRPSIFEKMHKHHIQLQESGKGYEEKHQPSNVSFGSSNSEPLPKPNEVELTRYMTQKEENECRKYFEAIQNSSDLNDADNPVSESLHRIRTIAWKNSLAFIRNLLYFAFVIVTPAVQIFISCIAMGGEPVGVKIGLVNLDSNDTVKCMPVPGCVAAQNYSGRISCRFLSFLDGKDIIDFIPYPNEEAAELSASASETWGYILFYDNYTESMQDRAITGMHAEPESIYGSRMKYRMDKSNVEIYRQITTAVLKAFNSFVSSVAEDCGIDPIVAEPPINIAQAVFEKDDVNFKEFLTPSILTMFMFFFSIAGSGLSYMVEKSNGTLSRSIVSGVTTFEIMVGYLQIQFIILCCQVSIALVIMTQIFKITLLGPWHCAFFLLLLVGVCGMSLGFLLGVFARDESVLVMIIIGAFVPNLLLAGVMWPREGLPLYLQGVSSFIPITYPGEALRSIATRGTSYTHPSVWPGFAGLTCWIVIIWVVMILFRRYKKF